MLVRPAMKRLFCLKTKNSLIIIWLLSRNQEKVDLIMIWKYQLNNVINHRVDSWFNNQQKHQICGVWFNHYYLIKITKSAVIDLIIIFLLLKKSRKKLIWLSLEKYQN